MTAKCTISFRPGWKLIRPLSQDVQDDQTVREYQNVYPVMIVALTHISQKPPGPTVAWNVKMGAGSLPKT